MQCTACSALGWGNLLDESQRECIGRTALCQLMSLSTMVSISGDEKQLSWMLCSVF